MATGALIRDFTKQYRELRYTNQGSIRLSEIEKNAYKNALTIEITNIDAPRYANLKTLPDNTHYGYVTQFRGSSVVDCEAIKFAKFRVFDIVNQGIWLYHQLTESVQVGAGVSVQSANASGNGVLGRLGELATGTVCFLVGIDQASGGGGAVGDFVLDFFDCSEPDAGTRDIAKKYRGFPITSPFPDLVKFKSDVPCSFLFRLESWYLVNPAVYITDSPVDSSDATDGESEYPEPTQGDGDGDGSEFPSPSPKDVESDPRDYGSSNEPPPFVGGQCADYYNVTVEYSDVFVGDPRYVSRTVMVLGPIFGLGPLSETDNTLAVRAAGGNVSTGLATLPFPCATQPQFFQNCRAKIVSVSKVNGSADNCGNPPQSAIGQI